MNLRYWNKEQITHKDWDKAAYLIPHATDDEFLIEKTPTYSQQFSTAPGHIKNWDTKMRANQMLFLPCHPY